MNARKIKKNVLRLDNSDRERGGGAIDEVRVVNCLGRTAFFFFVI